MAEKNTGKSIVIVVAGGEGKRFGSPKVFAVIKGKTVLDRCLEAFEGHPGVAEIILVLKDPEEQKENFGPFSKVSKITKGGIRRQDSVLSGFQVIDPSRASIVLVHDAARPLVSRDLIDRVIEAADRRGAAVPVIPVFDTIKKVENDMIRRTLKRQGLFQSQTPQGFSYKILKRALALAKNEEATDEAACVEKMGHPVCAVVGDPKNIKITVPSDLKIAEALVDD
jgi:2-C-methyl-D-erythritol 4-phosphate cytidylyltransferase